MVQRNTSVHIRRKARGDHASRTDSYQSSGLDGIYGQYADEDGQYSNIYIKFAQDNWELVDTPTFVPFESKVLVRNTEEDIWKPAIFGCYANKTSHYYVLGGTCWSYCIPYEGNEHLRGKIEDCDKRYKTWEK